MRLIHALHDFLTDLVQGDPVALTLAAVFLALLLLPLTFWIIDMRKKNNKSRKGRK